MMTTHIESAFSLKSHQPDGFFCGYASVFQVLDHHQEVVAPHAFQASLKRWSGKGKMPKMLWQHDQKCPIGVWTEITEDEHGLYVKGQLLLNVEAGREAYALMKAGVIDSLSIGFRPVKAKRDSKSQVRVLEEVDLMEISLVTFAANPEAKITAVKRFDGDKLPTKRSTDHINVNQPKEKQMSTIDTSIQNTMAIETDMTAKENHFMHEQHLEKLAHMEQMVKKSADRLEKMEVALKRPGTSDAAHHAPTGFNHFIRKGIDELSMKAMISSSDQQGGYLIPTGAAHLIHQQLELQSPIRKLASIATINNNTFDMLIDKVDADAGWVAETGDRAPTSVSDLIKLSIPVHEVYAKPQVSQRLLDDSGINIEAWLAQRIADKMARIENQAFLFGDGDNKPKGILSYPTVELGKGEWGKFEVLSALLNENTCADILIDAFYALKADYLPGSCWLMSRKMAAHIRKLKDQTGSYIWQNSLNADLPNTLLGYPVYLCDELDQAENSPLIFGNLKVAYQVVDRAHMSLLRDPYSSKPYVEFYATKRVGGAVMNFDALKIITLIKE